MLSADQRLVKVEAETSVWAWGQALTRGKSGFDVVLIEDGV